MQFTIKYDYVLYGQRAKKKEWFIKMLKVIDDLENHV